MRGEGCDKTFGCVLAGENDIPVCAFASRFSTESPFSAEASGGMHRSHEICYSHIYYFYIVLSFYVRIKRSITGAFLHNSGGEGKYRSLNF